MSISTVFYAQKLNEQTVRLTKEVVSESTILLKSITNESGYDIKINIKKDGISIATTEIKNGESKKIHQQCDVVSASVQGSVQGGSFPLWDKKKTKAAWKKANTPKVIEESNVPNDDEALKPEKTNKGSKNESQKTIKRITGNSVISSFLKKYEQDNYWSISSIRADEEDINNHIEALKNWTDKDAYIKNKDLNKYLSEQSKIFNEKKESINDIAAAFLLLYKNKTIISEFSCKDSIISIFEERAEIRKNALNQLRNTIDADSSDSEFDLGKINKLAIINIAIIVAIILSLLTWFVFAMQNRKKQKRQGYTRHQPIETNTDTPTIVVRRKTTSILKKQSLEDVIGNKAYWEIDCSDFCSDSAVRKIFIKNTCIKDIYNMYAEDLRNPDNPKEDGCMILGRWVYEEQANEYYVSFEETVQPGDDAVFQEYELNFGGKIKLKVAEKLRKLRRDSNLQYDLTCWVHSHPGLGVFFSNSDSSVQMQLKHPSHPNFLTAIVVDILTPQQEFGIFTFKHDSTINSKNDLKKMYSLEDLHKWAVESDRLSFKADDYYDTLSKSEALYEDCKGIQLNNSAIIDLCSIITESNMGLVGWAHGYMTMSRGKKEYIVNSILSSEQSTDNDMLGSLVIGTHRSIPSIRKAISNYSDKVRFVLFYSLSQETLTTIPIDNLQLSMDEKFYSEEKLEELKIWTRRKR